MLPNPRYTAIAALLTTLTACSTTPTTNPDRPPLHADSPCATQPASPLTDAEKNERLVNARAALANSNPREALQLLAPLSATPDQPTQILLILAKIGIVADPNAPEAPAFASENILQVRSLVAAHPKDARLLLLQLYLDNGEMRIDAMRAKIMDPALSQYDLAIILAALHAAKSQWPQELAALRLAEAERPAEPLILTSIFTAALNAENFTLARQYLDKISLADIDHAGGSYYRGILYLHEKKYEFARDTLLEASLRTPDSDRVWLDLGTTYLWLHQPKDALTAANRALAINPNSVLALRLALFIQVRQATLETLPAIRARLDKALKLAPNDPDLLADQDLIGDPRDVIATRSAIAAARPNDLYNLLALAEAYGKTRQYQPAIDLLKPALEKHPNELHLVAALAKLYNEAGQSNDAFILLEGYEVNPDPKIACPAFLLAAELHKERGEVDAAIECARLAVPKDTTGANTALRRLGDLYFDVDRMHDAELTYQSIRDAGDKDPVILRRLIETLIRQDQFTRADQMLSAQLAQFPDDPELLLLSGYELIKQNKPEEALQTCDHVLKLNHDNLDALYYRALARYTLKRDLPAAIQDLERILRATPNVLSTGALLARAYRLVGQNADAARIYRQLLDKFPATAPGVPAVRREYDDFIAHSAPASQPR